MHRSEIHLSASQADSISIAFSFFFFISNGDYIHTYTRLRNT